MTFTALMAVVSSSFAMSVTGGGLTAYEARAIQASVASAFGNEAAAAELERATPYSTAPAVHLIPMRPIVFSTAEESADLNGELLGGPPLQSARVFAIASAQAPMPIEEACAGDATLCAAPDSLPADADFELAAASVSTLH